MGRMENDPFLKVELERSRAKIPSFFRMTPRKKKVLRILFTAIGILEILVVCLFPRWLGFTSNEVTDFYGKKLGYHISPTGYIKAIFAVAALAIPLVAYMIFSHLFERDAFREASRNALETREKSKGYFEMTPTYAEAIPDPEEEEEEDPFADAPYAMKKKKPSGIAGGAQSAEDPLLTQLREKNLLGTDPSQSDPATEDLSVEKTSEIKASDDKATHDNSTNESTTNDGKKTPEAGPNAGRAPMKDPVRRNWDKERFGGDLLSQIVPQKYQQKQADDPSEKRAVTVENMQKTIAEGPPPPNYINPYATTDLHGVLKSAGKQEPDEIDLFEPDEDIEIFKK